MMAQRQQTIQWPNGPDTLLTASLLLSLATAMTFLLLIVSIRVGTVLASAATPAGDAFDSYQAMMSWEPAQILERYTCWQQSAPAPWQSCVIFPEDGSFQRITVDTSDGRVSELTFLSDSLRFRDLLRQWGEPESARKSRSSHTVTFTWDRGSYHIYATLWLRRRPGHVQQVILRLD